MIFLTNSATYNFLTENTATFTEVSGDGTNLLAINDYLFNTAWEWIPASKFVAPTITFDLKAATEINSIWFQSENINSYQLHHSFDNINFDAAFGITTGEDNGINTIFNFTTATKRYWRLTITSVVDDTVPAKIYELQLMKQLIDFNVAGDEIIELKKIIDDVGGYSYRLANQDLVSYEGQTERGKAEITVSWQYLRKEVVVQLEEIWVDLLNLPILTIYPEPDEYPEEIFQVYWSNKFDFNYGGESIMQGYHGTINLLEI